MGYTNLNHIIMVYTLRWETTTEPLADRPAKIVCCRFLILLIEQLREQQTSAHWPVIIIIYSFSLECQWGLCYDYYLEMLLDRCSLCAAGTGLLYTVETFEDKIQCFNGEIKTLLDRKQFRNLP